MQNDPNKVSAFAEYTVNIGNYSSVKIMGGLSLPLEPTDTVTAEDQLHALTLKVMATLKPIADEIASQRQPDLPRATGPAKPASVRSNRPNTGQDLGNGNFTATVNVDKVWFKGMESKTKPGKFGPGSVVAQDGTRYYTYEAADLKTADTASKNGQRVVVVYTIDNFGKNAIIKGGVSIFGGEREETPTDDASNY